jgi:hypothetical protein
VDSFKYLEKIKIRTRSIDTVLRMFFVRIKMIKKRRCPVGHLIIAINAAGGGIDPE